VSAYRRVAPIASTSLLFLDAGEPPLRRHTGTPTRRSVSPDTFPRGLGTIAERRIFAEMRDFKMQQEEVWVPAKMRLLGLDSPDGLIRIVSLDDHGPCT
jgi:hypothetical protein